MTFKDMLGPLVLALVITFGIQYFWGSGNGEKAVSQVHDITQQADPDIVGFKAQDYEIDFVDTKPKDFKAISTPVETSYGTFVFSTEGAAIEKAVFVRHEKKKVQDFDTFESHGQEDRMFLLAFQEKTPYYFDLVSHDDKDDVVTLQYRSKFDQGTLTKEYIVYKDINKVDLVVSIDMPKQEDKKIVRTRLLLPSPALQGLKDDTVRVFFEEQGSLKFYSNSNEIVNKLISGPIKMLGMDDRYFTYSLINDAGDFFQRAYFKSLSENNLRAFLQSKWINQSGSWKTSFYLGPKQIRSFAPVDTRLDGVLDFGWFSPLSKVLLKMLNVIHDHVQNYGWAIILLTLLLKLLLLPFTWGAEQKMKGAAGQREEMNRKLAYLKEKYKNDPERLAQERNEVMRKHGMPGIGSCLPMLLQIPIFISLNKVLTNSISLYKVPFLWLPNLAASDPYYILPILVVIAVVLHNPSSSKDPKQGLMPYAMALFFGAFTAPMASGLVIYILTSTGLGVVQAWAAKFFKRA